jgi:hypothetical protein
MRVTAVDRFLIWLAIRLRISPLMAHVLIMVAITALFIVLAPDAAVMLLHPLYLLIWIATLGFSVVVTWVSKGAHKDAWRRADVWQGVWQGGVSQGDTSQGDANQQNASQQDAGQDNARAGDARADDARADDARADSRASDARRE